MGEGTALVDTAGASLTTFLEDSPLDSSSAISLPYSVTVHLIFFRVCVHLELLLLDLHQLLLHGSRAGVAHRAGQ